MPTPHTNCNGGANATTCIQHRARPEARSRWENPRRLYQPDQIRCWPVDRGSSTTNRRSGANQRAHQSMINRRSLIVPPTLLGGGHAEIACEKQAADFHCLLLEMANIRESWRLHLPLTALCPILIRQCSSSCVSDARLATGCPASSANPADGQSRTTRRPIGQILGTSLSRRLLAGPHHPSRLDRCARPHS